MKHSSLIEKTLLSVIGLGLSQSAFAVTDEEFNALQERFNQTDEEFNTLQAQFNQLADQVDENSKGNTSNTTVGGYGELHYNNLSNGQGKDIKEIDFHRFVLFVNHEFNDKIRFFSEFEIEHATIEDTDNGSSTGSVAVEQAFVQFDLNEQIKANAGILLVPAGIINESHEPSTFYGVERNPIETKIIPTTWREGGAMLSGHSSSGLSYDIAIHSGLDGGTNIRGGRQKVSNANASNLASTARAKYTGISGLTLSGTMQYQDDMTQNTNDTIGSATLLETHVRWNIADFTLTGLYARWDIDVDSSAAQEDIDKEIQTGAYVEASYKIHEKVGIFVRQNQWDNGGTGDTKMTQTDVGFNYWPHENVVVKADYQEQNDIAGNFDGFNLGVGYQF